MQKFFLRGKRLLAEKKRVGAPKNNENAVKDAEYFRRATRVSPDEKQCPQVGDIVLSKPKRTVSRLADEYKVSRSTIERDASLAKVVDELASLAGPEAKATVLSGGVKIGHQCSPTFLKLDKRNKKKVAKMVSEQSVKSVEEAVNVASGNGSVPTPQKSIQITVLQAKTLHKLSAEIKRLVDKPSSMLSRLDINLKVDALTDLASKIHSKLKQE